LTDTVRDRIDQFIRYYAHATEVAAALEGDDHVPKLRKICFVAVLDALGKAIFPTRDNRGRFTQLVEMFGGWSDCKRVSLPHLAAMLARCPEPAFEGLRLLVLEQMGAWAAGHLISLDDDLEYEKARSAWPKDPALRTPVGSLTLEHFQHVHLLYTYRNLLIHEFRDRTDPISEDKRDVPFYVHGTIVGDVPLSVES
jgi:hypothetical protein